MSVWGWCFGLAGLWLILIWTYCGQAEWFRTRAEWLAPLAPSGSQSKSYHINQLARYSLFFGAACLTVICFLAHGCFSLERDQALIAFTHRNLFNGVSLLLPSLLAFSACFTLSYGLLRRAYFTDKYSSKLRHCSERLNQDPSSETQAIPYNLTPNLLLQKWDADQKMWVSDRGCLRSKGLLVGVGQLLIAMFILFFHAWRTNTNSSGSLLLYWLAWIFLTLMQLGWWMSLVQVIDLFENLKALLETQRRRLHSGHFGRIGGFRDDDQPMTEVMEVVTYLKNGGSAGVGRFLLDSGPTSDDKVTRLRGQLSKSDDLFPSAADELVIIYQTLQVFFVHLRNHILTLAIAAGLLVLAVNSYPYTSLAWLRLLTTGGMLTIALLVCWFYAQLERDEFLSFLLGSTPDQIEWNWPMLQRLGFLVSIALMTLLFQVFPESGRWLGGLLGPALSLGK